MIYIIIILLLLNLYSNTNTIENFSPNKNIWLFGDSIFDHSKFNMVKKHNIENILSNKVKKINGLTLNHKGKAISGLTAETYLKAIKQNKKKVLLEIGDDVGKYISRDIVQNNYIDVSRKHISPNDIIFISIGANDFVDLIVEQKSKNLKKKYLLLSIELEELLNIIKEF